MAQATFELGHFGLGHAGEAGDLLSQVLALDAGHALAIELAEVVEVR